MENSVSKFSISMFLDKKYKSLSRNKICEFYNQSRSSLVWWTWVAALQSRRRTTPPRRCALWQMLSTVDGEFQSETFLSATLMPKVKKQKYRFRFGYQEKYTDLNFNEKGENLLISS